VLLCAVGLSLLVGPRLTPEQWQAVLNLRLLRLALGVFAGGMLGLVGAGLQGLLRNPLADPFTLGAASGAAFGAVLARLLGAASLAPLGGFAGALGTILLVYLLARIRGRVTVTGLVLAGVVTSFLFSSLTMLAVVLGRRTLGEAVYMVMGHLGFVFTSSNLVVFAVAVGLGLAGAVILLSHARVLDILSTGEDAAESLGVDARRTTLVVFVVSAVLVGAVVAFAGAISFVGLVVPHMVRLLMGPRHGRVMAGSFIGGAGLLLLADTAARSIVPGGLPLSVVTALAGVPFFVWLLRAKL
jgi:iron complex transport system permease protein